MSDLRDKIEKLLKSYEYNGERGGLADALSDLHDATIKSGLNEIEILADAIAAEVGGELDAAREALINERTDTSFMLNGLIAITKGAVAKDVLIQVMDYCEDNPAVRAAKEEKNGNNANS
jgi:hypothetical protein